ncbi:MAG TPA: TonB-dependent receptor [Bacteroidales bacterium]|jgi:iron complex outermembrane receptor protein|nr:TonB-dependent receptor [Bacteroidales bacterium]
MKSSCAIFILIILLGGRNTLGQEDTVSIEAVNVEAYHVTRQLRTIPGSLSVLNAGNLKLYDYTTLHSLNSLPGVTIQSGTYTTNRVIIRGMGSRTPYNTNRIRSYLNDIPLTTSDGLSSPEEIDIASISRLEIIKGPSSALYGSGLGGNINLYTPAITKNSFSAGIQYGSFNTMKPSVSASFLKGQSGLWAGLSHLHSDGYRENSRYDRTSILLTASRNSERWKTEFLFLLLSVNSGIPSSLGKTLFENDPKSAAPNWMAIKGYKKYFRGLAGFSLTGRLSDVITNKFSLFGRGIDSYERRPFNNLDDQSISVGIRNKLNVHSRKTDLVLGLEWINEEYAWKLDTNEFEINNNRENRSHLNVFGVLYYQPLSSLNVSLAAAVNYVRYKLHDHFADNGIQSARRSFPLIFSPRLGVNYLLMPNWAVYASAGHGFSLPSPEETLLPAGDLNPSIKHEDGWQAEAGSRLNVEDKFAIDATIYWIELDNLLVTKRLTEDLFTGINAGKTRHKGFEVMINGKLFKVPTFPGELNADLSYTYTSNEFISFTDDAISYDGNDLPGIPDHVLYLKILWNPVRSLGIFSDIRYTGRQFLNDANTIDLKSYFLGNLKISADFKLNNGNLELYAGVNNAGNVAYASMLLVNAQGFGGNEPRYYYPGLPRHYYAGIIYNF